MIALHRILVATDFSEPSDAALLYGRALARTFGAELEVVHVADNVLTMTVGVEGYVAVLPQLQKDVEDAARARLHSLLLDSDGSGPRAKAVVLASNAPAAAIAEYAKRAGVDLIVMGTHGRGAVSHFLMGSVAENVVRSAPCPVLTVRHPERDFVLPDTLEARAAAGA